MLESYLYDAEKLKEDVNPIDVAVHLGIKLHHKGKNIFIECPEHPLRIGKNDKHATNCVLGKTFDNAYYCFSCGARGDVFHLIANHEALDIKRNFRKICKIAAESTGDEAFYRTNADVKQEKSEKKKEAAKLYPVLSDEQYELLGIRKVFSIKKLAGVYSPDEVSEDDADILTKYTVFHDDWEKEMEYLDIEEKSIGICDIILSDPEMYFEIIKDTCKRKKESISELIRGKLLQINEKEDLMLNNTDIQMIISELKQKYIKIIEIEMLFGIESEIEKWD